MKTITLLSANLLAVLVLSTSSVAWADSEASERTREINMLSSAKISPSEALSAAEKETGARATAIGFEKHDGEFLYEIRTASKDGSSTVFVNPASGAVTEDKGNGLLSFLYGWDEDGDFEVIGQSSISLASAISIAERQTGGTALEARFSDDDEAPTLEVEVAGRGGSRRVTIDGHGGNVLKIAPVDDDMD